MDEDYKLIDSPLSQTMTRDGVTIKIHIYRGEHEPGWILEVVDETDASTVWDETFKTDLEAFEELIRTINTESIRTFIENPKKYLH